MTGVLVARSGSFLAPLVVTAAVALIVGCLPIIFLVGNIDHEFPSEPNAAPA